jgi:C4-dicarboxylate transporter, DctM subunit
MTNVMLGFIFLAVMILLIVIRIPVAFAAMSAGVIGMMFIIPPQAAFQFLVSDLYTQFSSYTFSLIPMFVIMGYFAEMSGMTVRLFDAFYTLVGWVKGGLCAATVATCAAFAAVCGSGAATAATIGKVAYPQMKKYGYQDQLSTGTIAAAGTLGPLIPPSGTLVVYAIMTEQSITKCLLSGIIPGIMIATFMGILVFIMCKMNPALGPAGPKTTLMQKIRVLPNLAETLTVFLFVIGGMFGGLFSPTQAGTAGVIATLGIGLVRRGMTFKKIWDSASDALLISCMIMFMIAGSIVFGHFLSLSTLSFTIIDWVNHLPVPSYMIMLMIILFYMVGTCLMDSLGLIVLTLPIIAPMIFKLGYDPIWFGLIICMMGEVGAITPPVGISVYVVKALVPGVPLSTIFKGIVPFLGVIILALILVIIFPQLATFIPSLTQY